MPLYLPRDRTERIPFRRLPAGVLAFSPAYEAWLFTALLEEGDIWWAQLTGEDAPRLRQLDAGDDSLVMVLTDYRIELDLTSGYDGRHERLPNGVAFDGDAGFGFGAMVNSARFHNAATAVGFDGVILPNLGARGSLAYYKRWRAVTGDRAKPTSIFEIEGASWPE